MTTQPRGALEAAKMAPVQGYSAGIPWSMHLEAYDAYVKKWGEQQALIEGNCRGGFGVKELDEFIPGWRDRVSEIAQLRAQVAALLSAAAEGDKFRELAYVPGAWRCPKCKLRIMASVMSAQDGGMSANNDPQACANGCGPMWRITEREDRQEAQRFAIELSERLAPAAGGGPSAEATAALRFVYDHFCGMDNGDEPLEKYPQRAVDALADAGWAVVPCGLPFAVLGEAAQTGMLETGNPKHIWEWLIAKTRIYPFCAIDASIEVLGKVDTRALSHALNCLGLDAKTNTPDFELAEQLAAQIRRYRGESARPAPSAGVGREPFVHEVHCPQFNRPCTCAKATPPASAAGEEKT